MNKANLFFIFMLLVIVCIIFFMGANFSVFAEENPEISKLNAKLEVIEYAQRLAYVLPINFDELDLCSSIEQINTEKDRLIDIIDEYMYAQHALSTNFDDAIINLKRIEELTLEDYFEHINLKNCYFDLSDIAKRHVTRLIDLLFRIDYIKHLAKEEFMLLQEELPEDILTLDADVIDKISYLRATYDLYELSKLNIDAEVFLDLEEKVKAMQKNKIDAEDAEEVYLLIEALPQDLSIEHKESIEEIRSLYETMSYEGQQLVANYNIFLVAEIKMQSLLLSKQNADDFDVVLQSINPNITLEDKEDIVQIRYEYNLLTAETKYFVTYLVNLIEAEEKIALLESARLIAESVSSAIYLIYDVTICQARLVEDIRLAYDSLTEDAKSFVYNYWVLEAAEQRIQELTIAKEQGEVFEERIGRLTEVMDNIDTDEERSIQNAGREILIVKADYEELDEDTKLFVKNAILIYRALENVDRLRDNYYAGIVITMIAQLGEEFFEEAIPLIESARIAYDTLPAGAKHLVNNYYTLLMLENEANNYNYFLQEAEEVDTYILSIGIFDYSKKESIKNARLLYESLSDCSKVRVTKLPILLELEQELMYVIEQKEVAKSVILIIANLPLTVNLENEEDIIFARSKYLELSNTARAFVENYQKLLILEETILILKECIAKSEEIIALIQLIPEEINLASEPFIMQARTKYNEANEETRQSITNYHKLESAERALERYKSDLSVMAVVNEIALLSNIEDISIATKPSIISARQAYEQLQEIEKRKVDNYVVLVFAEQRLVEIELLISKAHQVVTLINDLPIEVTLMDKDNIYEVYEKYQKVAEEYKANVTNFAKLVGLVEKISDLQAVYDNALAVVNLIKDLPSRVSYEDKEKIQQAYNSYSLLSSRERVIVYDSGEYVRLIQKVDRISSLEIAKQKAELVDTQILLLPLYPDITHSQNIRLVREDYTVLDRDAKAFIENIDLLNVIEKRLQKEEDIYYALIVDNMIQEIASVVKLDDKEQIISAREAYNCLTHSQKLYVEEYMRLVISETQIDELDKKSKRAAYEFDIFTECLVGRYIQIKDIELIVHIRAEYDNLTESAKSFVSALSILVAAEQELSSLVNAKNAASEWEELLEEMPSVLSVEHLDWIENLLNLYDNLSDKEKTFATRYQDALNAYEYITDLQNSIKANYVVEKIENIPNNLMLSDIGFVQTTRQEYDALADTSKVHNYILLTSAEKKIERLLHNNYLASEMNLEIIEFVPNFHNKEDAIIIYYRYQTFDEEVKALVDYEGLEDIMTEVGLIDDLVIQAIGIQGDIQKLGQITLEHESTLILLRNSYDLLPSYIQRFVINIELLEEKENYIVMLKEAEQKASAVILLIEELGEISLESEYELSVSNNAYQDLSDLAKERVHNYNVLERANQLFDSLTYEKRASEFDELVLSLPSIITLENALDIESARELYDNMSVIEKVYVNNYLLLLQKEKEMQIVVIALQKEAKVISLIEEIPQEISLSDRQFILSAVFAYQCLDSASKERIPLTLLDKLYNAESIIKHEYSYYVAAQAVVAKIQRLPNNITLEWKEEILILSEAYDLLSTNEKEYVTNYEALVFAQSTLSNLLIALADAEVVVILIEQLPDAVTLLLHEDMLFVRSEYSLLSNDAKKFVHNYSDFVEKEGLLLDMQRSSSIQKVVDCIDSIDTTTFENINEAREGYDNLQEEYKPAVSNYCKLINAEALYQDYVQGLKALTIINDIANLPSDITISEEDRIVLIRYNYEKLLESGKQKVTNLGLLLDAEARLTEIFESISFAEIWDTQVSQLQDLDISSLHIIQSLREQYEALSTKSKSFVTQYDIFVQKEGYVMSEMVRLLNLVNIVQNAISEIPDINSLVIRDIDKVMNARELYDDLEEVAKSKVDNYELLEKAELQIYRLQKYSDFNSSISRINYRDREWTIILEYVEVFIEELFLGQNIKSIDLAYQNISEKVITLKTDLEYSKLQAVEDITRFAESIGYMDDIDFSQVYSAVSVYDVALAIDLISDNISMKRQIEINEAVENAIYEIGNYIVGVVDDYAFRMQLLLEFEFDITSEEAKYSDFERYLEQAFDKNSVELIILLHKKAAVTLMFAENEATIRNIKEECIDNIMQINTLDTKKLMLDIERAKKLASAELRLLLDDHSKASYTEENWKEIQLTVLGAMYALDSIDSLSEINKLLNSTQGQVQKIEVGSFVWVIWLVIIMLAISSIGFAIVLTIALLRLKTR